MKILNFTQFCSQYFTQFDKKFEQKYHGTKFDGHTHVWDIKKSNEGILCSQAFHIHKILAIVDEHLKPDLDEQYPGMFHYARFIRSPALFQQPNHRLIENMIDEYYAQGYNMVKFWFAPRWRDYIKERHNLEPTLQGLADPILEPLFSELEDRNMRLLIHISDPDIWYEKKYLPESFYGAKQQHLDDLETIIQRHPKLIIQGAHLAAQPEHLSTLSRWLDLYPNFVADISSARWMAREFSKNPEVAREFIIKYAKRIFFGSDLSYGRDNGKENQRYFFTRYLTYLALFETSVRELPLPFPDPENNNQTVINGLDLPLSTLTQIYWQTPIAFFNAPE